MKLSITISMVCMGFCFLQINSCQNVNVINKVNPIIIQKVEATPGGLVAILDKHEYANGLLTSEEDRVRIIDPRINKPDGFIIFAEDGESEAEKPIITWKGNKLVITISRDAYITYQLNNYENIQIEINRRVELQNSPPIGSLITALHDSQRIWNRADLTAKIWQTCLGRRKPAPLREITAWEQLLDIDRLLKTDNSLKSGIHIREVALTCIEGLTGESFYPSDEGDLPARDYLAAGNNFNPAKVRVAMINPRDLPAIHNAIQAWLKNYTKLN